jgi:hypothetical protein
MQMLNSRDMGHPPPPGYHSNADREKSVPVPLLRDDEIRDRALDGALIEGRHSLRYQM